MNLTQLRRGDHVLYVGPDYHPTDGANLRAGHARKYTISLIARNQITAVSATHDWHGPAGKFLREFILS